MQAIIYGLYDPSEVGPPHIRYVGYTSKDSGVRVVEHISESKLKASNHRHKWIRSLVRRNIRPAILILELIDEDIDWKEREREWISKLTYLGLTNSTKGGEGLIDPSPEVRQRISAKVSFILKGNQYRKGIPHTAASKAAMSASAAKSEKVQDMYKRRKGMDMSYLQTPEVKEKRRLAAIGKECPWSRDAALKMTENNRGKIWVNNGAKQNRYAPDSAIPDGWVKGLLPFSEETLAKRNESIRRAVAATPKSEILARKDWLRGKLIWITDEATSKYHPKDEPIPEGWRRGMAFIPRKKPT